ncbi:hypothetical protein [Brevibacillus daliensis]|uniref:hypothetical protein n=1 Tax=Brevibacillus daliensis TaxID=2892995 RepID=UPI001E30DBD4|nr:hypothetical protein [Brevibacillus daliensis]
MNLLIKEYAKRLKLSWIGQHYQEVEANTNEEYLHRILENELQQRKARKINLLFKQSSLPRITEKPFDWSHIQMGQGLTSDHDRLFHHSHLIIFNGESHRYKESNYMGNNLGVGKWYIFNCHLVHFLLTKTNVNILLI